MGAVTRRVLLALGGAAVICVVVASNLPAASSPTADWSRPQVVRAYGMTAVVPRAWDTGIEGAALVVSTQHIEIWLARYGPAHADEFPARPGRFQLRDEDRTFQTCGFDFVGWNIVFSDRGQSMQAIVRVDPGAPKSDALRVLDSIGVAG
jgi:hypothetical protein